MQTLVDYEIEAVSGGDSQSYRPTFAVQPGSGTISCCSVGPFSIDLFSIVIDGLQVVQAVGSHEMKRRPGAGG